MMLNMKDMIILVVVLELVQLCAFLLLYFKREIDICEFWIMMSDIFIEMAEKGELKEEQLEIFAIVSECIKRRRNDNGRKY